MIKRCNSNCWVCQKYSVEALGSNNHQSWRVIFPLYSKDLLYWGYYCILLVQQAAERELRSADLITTNRKSNKSIDWTKFMNRQTKSKLNEDWKEWLCKSFVSYQMRKSFLIRYMCPVTQNASRKNINVLITIQMHISFFRINLGIHFQLYYSIILKDIA